MARAIRDLRSTAMTGSVAAADIIATRARSMGGTFVAKSAERQSRASRTPAKRPPRLRVLAVRHAIAVEREDFAKDGGTDALRPLTKTGRRKMRQAAEGLLTLVSKIDALAASPLTRAAQTADILAR